MAGARGGAERQTVALTTLPVPWAVDFSITGGVVLTVGGTAHRQRQQSILRLLRMLSQTATQPRPHPDPAPKARRLGGSVIRVQAGILPRRPVRLLECCRVDAKGASRLGLILVRRVHAGLGPVRTVAFPKRRAAGRTVPVSSPETEPLRLHAAGRRAKPGNRAQARGVLPTSLLPPSLLLPERGIRVALTRPVPAQQQRAHPHVLASTPLRQPPPPPPSRPLRRQNKI